MASRKLHLQDSDYEADVSGNDSPFPSGSQRARSTNSSEPRVYPDLSHLTPQSNESSEYPEFSRLARLAISSPSPDNTTIASVGSGVAASQTIGAPSPRSYSSSYPTSSSPCIRLPHFTEHTPARTAASDSTAATPSQADFSSPLQLGTCDSQTNTARRTNGPASERFMDYVEQNEQKAAAPTESLNANVEKVEQTAAAPSTGTYPVLPLTAPTSNTTPPEQQKQPMNREALLQEYDEVVKSLRSYVERPALATDEQVTMLVETMKAMKAAMEFAPK